MLGTALRDETAALPLRLEPQHVRRVSEVDVGPRGHHFLGTAGSRAHSGLQTMLAITGKGALQAPVPGFALRVAAPARLVQPLLRCLMEDGLGQGGWQTTHHNLAASICHAAGKEGSAIRGRGDS